MSLRPVIAVDWGTSSLRGARLGAAGEVIESRHYPRGIMTVAKGQFEAVFEDCFGDWMQTPDALCLISGMAGSQQGWQEAPYCPCPAGFEELTARLHWLQTGRMAIVPGLSCLHEDGLPVPQHDVMRGEEIQIFGALALTGLRDAMVVLPGTHSKWAQVSQGRVQGFRSFMTGEVFALLSQHSILSRTLPADAPWHEAAFLHGVQLAQRTPSVLSSIFATRTLALFGSWPAEQHPSFLSGLLIGEELRAMAHTGSTVLLVGNAVLTQRYAVALNSLNIRSQSLGDEATWAGHMALAERLQKKP